jgi:hypothetical protein
VTNVKMRRPVRSARDGGSRPGRTAVRENAAAPPTARGIAEAPGAPRRVIVGVDDSPSGLAATIARTSSRLAFMSAMLR